MLINWLTGANDAAGMFNPWVGKIPWRRERLPTPVFWPGELTWGRKESDTTEQLSLSLFTFILNRYMLSVDKNRSYLELESKMENLGSIWGTGVTPVC